MLEVVYPESKIVSVESNLTFEPFWAYIHHGEIMEDHSVTLRIQGGHKCTGDVIMATILGEGWEYEVWG
jgi:hypothetical protein